MMVSRSFRFFFLTLVISVSALLHRPAVACTVGEEMHAQLPFNAADISNADRLAIANIVIEAKKWPDVDIQAVVIVGAYKDEERVEWLKALRYTHLL